MTRITPVEPETYENDNYKIEYRKNAENFQDFRVTDKQTGEKQRLTIATDMECYNHDGAVRLTLINENATPVNVTAVRPKTELRSKEPTIGLRSQKGEDGLYHSVMDINGLMSIHRALQNGNFKSEDGSSDNSDKVLQFMDKYIFNTDEHHQLLAEYMTKYPLTKHEPAPQPQKQTKPNILSLAMKRFGRSGK